jgi:aminopeptidase YwaD
MGAISRNRFFAFIAVAALFLTACGGTSKPPATATVNVSPSPVETQASASPQPAVTTAPPSAGALEPDGKRILDDVISLSVGPRSSATEQEEIAANAIADRLRKLGYEVTIQEFSVGTQQGRSSELSLISPTELTVPTLPLAGSPTSTVQGKVVAVPSNGAPEDFPPQVSGAIALIQRGTLLFKDKVANATAAGAIGVIIYNNEAGTFLGGADSNLSIPTVTISQNEGQKLIAALEGSEVEAKLGVGALSDATSRNVIAKPPGAQCQTISGGHYDSVPQAPGASDNATGTSTVLEIAAILMNRGEAGNNCFVLFGAEELGLLGSRYYVSALTQEEKDRIKAMINYDMVGVGDDTWWLVGSQDLQQRLGALAASMNIDTIPSTLVGTTSDQASFLDAGIPAILLHRWEDPLLHTPQDVSDRVRPELLEQAARMGLALVEALNAEG